MPKQVDNQGYVLRGKGKACSSRGFYLGCVLLEEVSELLLDVRFLWVLSYLQEILRHWSSA